jgi:hypothetical protein
MGGRARGVFNWMLVPTVVVGLVAYARFQNVNSRTLQTTWREHNGLRLGNPYTTPLPAFPLSGTDKSRVDDRSGDGGSAERPMVWTDPVELP